ncbi:MAG: protein kinase [Candidatus Krumholzibacteriota bacterium]|nr:protein kinase [Candidatus Krumholzibacteriota bacterium]
MGRVKRPVRFDLRPGEILAGKFEVVRFLGRGWEGEVYRVRERGTGIERAAKLFYPQRDRRGRAAAFHARKLHKLRHCPLLIQYHARETIDWRNEEVTMLVSDLVEGMLLSGFLATRPGRRLGVFEGLHLLHTLAAGVEIIHDAREYHGDLHDDNVMVRRVGLGFHVKLVDMYDWGVPSAENIREDVVDLVRIFYDCLGGAPRYARQPRIVKEICRGLKRSLIVRRFRTAGALRRHIEQIEWD